MYTVHANEFIRVGYIDRDSRELNKKSATPRRAHATDGTGPGKRLDRYYFVHG
jgi:hypothetical protein